MVNDIQPEVEIVIGIPGKWQTRNDIVRDIASKSEGLLFAAMVVMDTATNESYRLEVYDNNPHLAEAFALAGRQSLTESDIQAIQSHTFTLYLIAKGGSLEKAQEVLSVGSRLLQAGGLAVKVETTGKAHSAKDWFALTEAHNETALYHAFVTLVGDERGYYSCGMHNLGHRDALVKGSITADDAARLLQTFLLYALVEKPAIEDGHTFGEDQQSPRYYLRSVPCETYPTGDPFHNPYGMWELESKHRTG